jgi:hypothetical protein
MRYSLLLLPIAAIGLAGCVASGGNPRQISSTDMTPSRSATYMTVEQSGSLMTLPGDTTTLAQMRYLSRHSAVTENQRTAGLWPQQ